MAQASAVKKKFEAIPESGTVTVACNVVNGLMLNVYDFEDSQEPVLGGGTRIQKVAVQVGDSVHIKGPRFSRENQQRGPKAYGYVLTSGVSAEFMRRWMKENENTLLVKNECILVQKNNTEAKAAAKDNAGRVSGLEPIVPGTDDKGKPNDPRIPRPLKTAIGSVGGVTTDDENSAEELEEA